MKQAVALALVLLLTGCATGKGQIKTGDPVLAPGGYYILCGGKDKGPECP